jgi:hypothetical protein
LISAAYTDHGDIKTAYLFAFNNVSGGADEGGVTPADLGFNAPVYAYDYFAGTGRCLGADQMLSISLNRKALAYYIVTSIGKSGMAFLGDANKLVSNGKQRIASLKDEPDEMSAEVQFAPTEKAVILHGYSATVPKVTVKSGKAEPVRYDPVTGQFTIEICPDLQSPPDRSLGDPVRCVTVVLKNQTNKVAIKSNNGCSR